MDKKILPNVLISLLILTTHSSLAETQAKNVNGTTVNAKCHVVLANAKEEILLYRIKAKKLKSLPQRVNGSQVTAPSSNKKVNVLKVHECVEDEQEFSSVRAKLLDKNFAR